MKKKSAGRITIKKMTVSAFLCAYLVGIKYALGFLPGIEFTTFSIIAISFFLPLQYSLLTNTSFILLTGIIYGFATWWIVYWPMFLTETLLTFALRKWLKNNIVFGIWCGFWGFSIMFWYFGSDWIIFGKGYAITNFFSALVTNCIEGACNLIAGMSLMYPLKSFFNKAVLENSEIKW